LLPTLSPVELVLPIDNIAISGLMLGRRSVYLAASAYCPNFAPHVTA
jgi:hypothetical protein